MLYASHGSPFAIQEAAEHLTLAGRRFATARLPRTRLGLPRTVGFYANSYDAKRNNIEVLNGNRRGGIGVETAIEITSSRADENAA